MARRRFADGKKIDTWKWRTDDGVDCELDLYLVQTSSGARFHAVNDSMHVDMEGTDIVVLKKTARAEVESRLTVTWRKVLHVEVRQEKSQRNHYGGDPKEIRAMLKLEVEQYWIAEINGERVSKRQEDGRAQKYWPGEYDEGWTTKRKDYYSKKMLEEECDPHLAVIIDDTPESRAALEKIQLGLVTLGDQLRALLKPSTLSQVLARIAGNGDALLPALPAPAEVPAPPRTRKKKT